MKVIVDNQYTYETDETVRVGDTVVLPTPYWLAGVKGPTWEGTVTKVGSDYDGPCAKVISVKEAQL